MPNYKRMNKILEEEGTLQRAKEEETSYAEHEADEYIREMENRDMELED